MYSEIMRLESFHKLVAMLDDVLNFDEFIVLSAMSNWYNNLCMYEIADATNLNLRYVELLLKNLEQRKIINLKYINNNCYETVVNFELV